MTTSSSPGGRLRRRSFLAVSAVAGSGLALGYAMRAAAPGPAAAGSAAAADGSFRPSALIRISHTGVVTLVAKQMEVGQGVKTSLPMILAEELEVDWQQVLVEQADLDEAYGDQFSGASRSTRVNYQALRVMGATARSMLISAAAQALGVPEGECHAAHGSVHHTRSGRSLAYAALVARAARLPVPDARTVALKHPRDFKLIGTGVGGVDNPAIVSGRPLYGMDLRLPGMLYAVYERSPVPTGAAPVVDLAAVRALPGVQQAFALGGVGGARGLRPGVAIVASSTWAAFKARRQLQMPATGLAQESTAGHAEAAMKLLQQPAHTVLRQDGNLDRALAEAAHRVEAIYAYPPIAHAAMEPPNCTAHFHDGMLELWTTSQSPAWARDNVSTQLGLPKERIHLHIVRGGGAFGRGLSSDYVVEAAAIAMRCDAPVKLVWSREDDLRHDHPRAGGWHRLRGGVDAQGRLVAWHDHYVSVGRNGKPDVPLEGQEFPARWVPHCTLAHSVIDSALPTGAWRAPGANVHAWVIQSFIDELAHAAGRDPLEFRLALLGDRQEMRPGGLFNRGEGYGVARMRRVLQAAAERGRWGRPLPRGQGQGLAFHASYGGYAAQLAEVTVSPEGRLRVDRVVCVCDVGSQIVNASGAMAQVEGAIHDGLSAMWAQELTLEGGRVVQSNLHDYPLLRMADAPARIEVHFIASDHPVSGLGEPALPPVAPAVCNAIFRATGQRVRQLPLSRNPLAWGGAGAGATS